MAIPFIKSFRATTIFRAFLINSFISALIATIIVEVRYVIEYGQGPTYENIRKFFNGGNDFDGEINKVTSTFVIGFLVTMILYNILYVLIEYGGGLVTPEGVKYF